MRYAFPMKRKDGCPICKSTNGCEPMPGYLRDAPLSADDWRKIYEFMRYVELPFLHNLIYHAIQLQREE